MADAEVGSEAEAPGAPFALPFVSSACPPQMADHDTWQLHRFLRVEKIGSGLASSVYRVLDSKTNMQCALKVYDMRRLNRALQDSVMQEIAIHGRVHHPHILAFFAAFIDACYLFILLELAPSSDLYKRMPEIRRDEGTVTKYVIGPLVFTLAYMHELNIVHRDIKPENVLLRSSHILLSDFGFSIDVSKQRPITRLGTLHFMAPELLLNDPEDPAVRREKVPRPQRKDYGKEVDIWAVGVLAYELFTRQAPFDGDSEDAVIQQVCSGTASFPPTMTPDAVDFIAKCLERDPRRRPTAMQLTAHPMILNNMNPERIRELDPSLFLPAGILSGKLIGMRPTRQALPSQDSLVRRVSAGGLSTDALSVGGPADFRAAMHSQMVSRNSNGSYASLGVSPGYMPIARMSAQHIQTLAASDPAHTCSSAPPTPATGVSIHVSSDGTSPAEALAFRALAAAQFAPKGPMPGPIVYDGRGFHRNSMDWAATAATK